MLLTSAEGMDEIGQIRFRQLKELDMDTTQCNIGQLPAVTNNDRAFSVQIEVPPAPLVVAVTPLL